MADFSIAVLDSHGGPEGEPSTEPVPWWSFTKTLIAAAALRLAEQGRVALDEPFPDLPYTLRQVLQNRAGIGEYGGVHEYKAAVAAGGEPWTDEEVFARVPPTELRFQPDTGWAYSNVGYLLARRAVERAFGSRLREALAELALQPLGLRHSRLAETREDMLATPFTGGHGYQPGWAFHGFVVGPPVEAALALHRLVTGDLLSPASRALFMARHPIGGALPGRPWTSTGYGLGLMIGTMQAPGMPEPVQVLGHSAGGPGSVGAVYHAPETGRTAAVFAAATDEGITEFEALRRLTAGSRF